MENDAPFNKQEELVECSENSSGHSQSEPSEKEQETQEGLSDEEKPSPHLLGKYLQALGNPPGKKRRRCISQELG